MGVHVQKGSPDGHRIVFTGKADELPQADTGDVVFTLKEKDHKDFKRRGADLFVERRISLSEALCGFQLELTHLDGRKLLIKSAPGEIVKPANHRFDPLADSSDKASWGVFQGFDCPGIESVAQTEITDAEALKTACETKLKAQGVDANAFVIDSEGKCTYFKSGTREEILAAKKPRPGCTMYVVSDPNVSSQLRMMKAVEGEGMPTFKNPFIRGNLFLVLSIEFPENLSSDAQDAIQKLLPAPLNPSSCASDDGDVEVVTLSDMDPLQSFWSNQANMTVGGEAYDEDERQTPHGVNPQCAQM